MTGNGRPLIPYLRQSRAKERTISIEEQRRDVQQWATSAGRGENEVYDPVKTPRARLPE